MQELPNALAPLSAYKQFTLWKAVPSKRRAGKMDKFPCNAVGDVIDAHDSKHWLTADEACMSAQLLGGNYGVGFVFTSSDPFFFIDIDGAWNGQEWSELAKQLTTLFAGCTVEVSQSNTGLHIFGQYSGEEPDHACKNVPLGIEMYTSGRFAALTGINATGIADKVADAAINAAVSQYFPIDTTQSVEPAQWTTSHHPQLSFPPHDDAKLIDKACATTSATAAFGGNNKASFSDLWTRNVPALAAAFPSDTGQEYDGSSADAALALHLLWWCGGNCERVERLMRMSALVRDKWDNHKSYMRTTILSAASKCTSYYNPARDTVVREVDTIEPSTSLREGLQVMTADQQLDYFKGCVYVTEFNKVFTPDGMMLDSSRFNAFYGGYNFNLDYMGEKSTKKAFEAFTESQTCNFPKVALTCFRPALESGLLLREYGKSMVNTYVELDIPSVDADITPFMDHMVKLVPDERDRTILLSYMAACVQHKGHKFQWAPVVQGAKGNGKTLLIRVMMHALGRPYTHLPQAETIDKNFNSWLVNKLFIGVEEIYVPASRTVVLEVLKPMITNSDMGVEFKGIDQTTKEICCNFMFMTNHKDAIPVDNDERRYAIFYTGQQDIHDIVRDGMTGDYFPNLYNWCNNGGYAAITHFLREYDIPAEFNPATMCQRSPHTSSTPEAVGLSLGSVEQEVVEAIEEGRSGFAGGWINSFALDKLLTELRKDKAVPRNKRRDMLKKLGYDYHPSLKDGRVNNPIGIEPGKPRLFIKNGHVSRNLQGGQEIIAAYTKAQGNAVFGLDNPVNNDNTNNSTTN